MQLPGLDELETSIAKAVEGLDPKETAARVKAGESIEVEAGGKTVLLLPQELEVRTEQSEDTFSLEDHGWVVSLNTHLTEDLVLEGIARDFIRQVANFRKEADFKVDDRICLWVDGDEKVLEAVKTHRDFISAENLATKIELGTADKEHTFTKKIAGCEVRISLEKSE